MHSTAGELSRLLVVFLSNEHVFRFLQHAQPTDYKPHVPRVAFLAFSLPVAVPLERMAADAIRRPKDRMSRAFACARMDFLLVFLRSRPRRSIILDALVSGAGAAARADG
jgi:hypothetical protein